MAKNRNRKRGGRQERPAAGGRAAQQAGSTGPGTDTGPGGGPAEGARKQQRRFGHN
ncbi:hypothetical protein GCM10018793_14670 [Streptomyces sulfonofaciens]|uniref:Uncharacterized protein n=1 Tax=Streptomyces sulfonofaciens TaxID=68272 RepID=A0A919FXG7_9ACTN|nr:hypothetical protein [Streptomyces sulfonofaciens]GHH74151.1 hypothetical protein GCM10018793_14670 [Streptomyces sulfonofaciens]